MKLVSKLIGFSLWRDKDAYLIVNDVTNKVIETIKDEPEDFSGENRMRARATLDTYRYSFPGC